jgi:hypothetical protein
VLDATELTLAIGQFFASRDPRVPDSGDEFPAALSFMFALGRDRATEIPQAQAAGLAESSAADEAALALAERDGVPPIFLSEHRYQLALRRAEHDCITGFTEAPGTGALTWPDR